MGDLVIGEILVKDPSGVASKGALYWQQVMLGEMYQQFDEHTYPGYDLILTKNLGARETYINGSLVVHGNSEANCEAMFQVAQLNLVSKINKLTTPRGTVFERVMCKRFNAGRMYKWDTSTGYLMFVDFSFKALQPAS